MATLHEITDPADPRLADYRDLRDVELRKHLEAEHGLFLAEGEKVVRRAVEAGFAPRSFLMAPRWLDGLDDVLATTDAPCFVSARRWPRRSPASTCTGARWPRWSGDRCRRWTTVLAGARSVLVLEDMVDHTNVGAIFRSGAALGFDAVLLAPRCADPLYRRSIKVGDGRGVPDALDPAAGLVRRAADALGARVHDRGADPAPGRRRRSRRRSPAWTGWRWCSAPRGTGCRARWERSADRRAIIPMADGIDSLNVAAATAVACYVTARR